MKKTRFTETQIFPILKQHESGRTMKEVAREQWRIQSHYLQLEEQIWWYEIF